MQKIKVYLAYSQNYHTLLLEEGARICISYGRLSVFPEWKLPQGFSDYLIDSGGYQISHGTLKHPIYPQSYCFWLKGILPKYDGKVSGYCALDTNQADETIQNYEIMRSEGLTPIPVWKHHFPREHLDYYCTQSQLIAIGGLVGKGNNGKRYYRQLLGEVSQRYPENRFHMFGLGLTAAAAFTDVKPYSIDCSTWLNPSRFGNDILSDGKGGLREVELPEELKQVLVEDENFQHKMVRRTIKQLLSLEARNAEIKNT
ncbi:hypothetical protein ES703_06441 [subsurface metagenome]